MRGRNRGISARWLLFAATVGVCLAQPAPSSDGMARVVTLEGQVSVMRDSTPWALRVGDSLKPRQMVITGPDGLVTFEVSDGSTFEVFPNSRFVFRNNTDWRDLLDMFIGRVKVHIQKWGGQPNHNRVHTPTAVISVRGTIFDVTVEDEEATTLVVVDEGQVAVQHKLLPSTEKRLNAGEWLRVYKSQPLARNSADKGSIVRRVMNAMTDALYTVATRGPRGPGSIPGTGGGPTLPGDHSGSQPPPAPGGNPAPAPPTAPPPPPPGK